MGEPHHECMGGDGGEGAEGSMRSWVGLRSRGGLSMRGLFILARSQMGFPQGSKFFHCQVGGWFIFSLLAQQLVVSRDSSNQIPLPVRFFSYLPFHSSGLLGWHMQPYL